MAGMQIYLFSFLIIDVDLYIGKKHEFVLWYFLFFGGSFEVKEKVRGTWLDLINSISFTELL